MTRYGEVSTQLIDVIGVLFTLACALFSKTKSLIYNVVCSNRLCSLYVGIVRGVILALA